MNIRNLNKIKEAILISLGLAILFGSFSLIFYFGDWLRFAIVFLVGLFVGALAFPELNPKCCKYPTLYQISVGAVAGFLGGFAFNATIETSVSIAIIGGLLGFTAPYWLKHAPIP